MRLLVGHSCRISLLGSIRWLSRVHRVGLGHRRVGLGHRRVGLLDRIGRLGSIHLLLRLRVLVALLLGQVGGLLQLLILLLLLCGGSKPRVVRLLLEVLLLLQLLLLLLLLLLQLLLILQLLLLCPLCCLCRPIGCVLKRIETSAGVKEDN